MSKNQFKINSIKISFVFDLPHFAAPRTISSALWTLPWQSSHLGLSGTSSITAAHTMAGTEVTSWMRCQSGRAW